MVLFIYKLLICFSHILTEKNKVAMNLSVHNHNYFSLIFAFVILFELVFVLFFIKCFNSFSQDSRCDCPSD